MSCAPLRRAVDPSDAPVPTGELASFAPFALFRCERLAALLRPCICVLRQAASERQRTEQGSRGQGSDYPSCSASCAQGRAIRDALDPARSLTPRPGGPERGGRGFGLRRRDRTDTREQSAARERLRLVGALEPVPSIDDEPPDEQGEDAAV